MRKEVVSMQSKIGGKDIISFCYEALSLGAMPAGDKLLKECLGYTDEFSSFERKLKKIEKERSDLLRVMVVGQFRTGKSTLVNAIVRKNLSPTDDCKETTSDIFNFIPTDGEEYCQVVSSSGVISTPDIVAYFENYKTTDHSGEEVNIFVHTAMNYILIDTPGMGGSEKNEKTLMDNILTADSIVWVIDCTMIGTEKEQALMQYIKGNGVPVVLGLTFWDKVEAGERREIIGYCVKTYKVQEAEIFPMSNPAKGREGVDALTKYIDREIHIRNKEIRESAFRGSATIFLKELKNLFEEMGRELTKAEALVSRYAKSINNIKNDIDSKLQIFLKQRVNEGFIAEDDVKEEIVAAINDKVKREGFKDFSLEDVIPREYSARFINSLTEELRDYAETLWRKSIGDLSSKSREHTKIMQLPSAGPVAGGSMGIPTKCVPIPAIDLNGFSVTPEMIKAAILAAITVVIGGPMWAAAIIGGATYALNKGKVATKKVIDKGEIKLDEVLFLSRVKNEGVNLLILAAEDKIKEDNAKIANKFLEEFGQKMGLAIPVNEIGNIKNIIDEYINNISEKLRTVAG